MSVVIRDNGIWEVVPTNEAFPSEFLHLVGSNFPQCSCFYPLGEVVDGN